MIYIYIYIFIYLIEELLSSGAVINSKLFFRCPAFKYLPRDRCQGSWKVHWNRWWDFWTLTL